MLLALFLFIAFVAGQATETSITFFANDYMGYYTDQSGYFHWCTFGNWEGSELNTWASAPGDSTISLAYNPDFSGGDLENPTGLMTVSTICNSPCDGLAPVMSNIGNNPGYITMDIHGGSTGGQSFVIYFYAESWMHIGNPATPISMSPITANANEWQTVTISLASIPQQMWYAFGFVPLGPFASPMYINNVVFTAASNQVVNLPVYLGCFVDGDDGATGNRDLPYFAGQGDYMTQEWCFDACSSSGYLYAGLQDSFQCFCGNSYGSQGQRDTSECNMACAGNGGEACGAGWRNGVWGSL